MAWDGRGDAPQQGTVTLSLSSESSKTASVTFPVPFSAVPNLALSVGAAATYIVGWTSKTASGFTLNLRRFDSALVTASIDVNWRATL